MANIPKLYSHTRNKDGSYDSICMTCFATVGVSLPNGHLASRDKQHICDSAFLAERGILTQSDFILRLASPLPAGHPYPRSEEAA